jgi:hypothetical protein
MRYTTLLVFSLGLAAQLPAQQFRDFWTQCSPGAFQACVSVHVSVINHPPGVVIPGRGEGSLITTAVPFTEVRFRLSNLQGLPGYEAQGPWGLRTISLSGLALTSGTLVGGWNRHIASDGNATIGGALDMDQISPTEGGADVLLGLDYDSYLFGCDVPDGASPFAGYDTTCGGTITYGVFFGAGEFVMTKDAAVSMSWRGWEDGPSFSGSTLSARCTSGIDCVVVTPEPGTIVLLTTGIAALVGARARRRRREGTNVSEPQG